MSQAVNSNLSLASLRIDPLHEYVSHKNPNIDQPSLLQRIANAVGGPHILGQALGAALFPAIAAAFLSPPLLKFSTDAMVGGDLGMTILAHTMLGVAAAAGVIAAGQEKSEPAILKRQAKTFLTAGVVAFASAAIIGMATGIGGIAGIKTLINRTLTETSMTISERILPHMVTSYIFIAGIVLLDNLPKIAPENAIESLQRSQGFFGGQLSLTSAMTGIGRGTNAIPEMDIMYMQIANMASAMIPMILGIFCGTCWGKNLRKREEAKHRDPSFYFFKALIDNHLANIPQNARNEFIDNLKALDVSTLTSFTRIYLSQLLANKKKLTRENTPSFMHQNTTIAATQTTLMDAINGLMEAMEKLSKESPEEYAQIDFCKEEYVPKSEKAKILQNKGRIIAFHLASQAKSSLPGEEIERYINLSRENRLS